MADDDARDDLTARPLRVERGDDIALTMELHNPTARAAQLTMNREGIRRLAAETLGMPTSPYRFADSRETLEAAIADGIGYPCVVKPVMSSSGKGQSLVKTKADMPSFFRRLTKVCASAKVDAETKAAVRCSTSRSGMPRRPCRRPRGRARCRGTRTCRA